MHIHIHKYTLPCKYICTHRNEASHHTCLEVQMSSCWQASLAGSKEMKQALQAGPAPKDGSCWRELSHYQYFRDKWTYLYIYIYTDVGIGIDVGRENKKEIGRERERERDFVASFEGWTQDSKGGLHYGLCWRPYMGVYQNC